MFFSAVFLLLNRSVNSSTQVIFWIAGYTGLSSLYTQEHTTPMKFFKDSLQIVAKVTVLPSNCI
mgnify:FL=1